MGLNPYDTGFLDVDLEINSDGEIVNSYFFKPDELLKYFQSLLVLLLNMGIYNIDKVFHITNYINTMTPYKCTIGQFHIILNSMKSFYKKVVM